MNLGFIAMSLRRKLASCFFCFQAIALVAENFPKNTLVSTAILKPFSEYIALTTQWQSWDMFDTIPYDAQFTVKAFASDENNKETELGAVLPNLESIEQFTTKLRLHSFFYRIYPGSRSSDQYWQTYAKRLCVAAQKFAKENNKPPVKKIFVDFDTQRLRSLADIRRDGAIAYAHKESRGPFICP